MKAMIFAAGLGTRLAPLTNDRPKALVPVHGRPMLEWVVRRLICAGFDELVINLHHYPEMIAAFLKANHNFGASIQFSYEDELLDTGGGLWKAASFLQDEDFFLVHNADILSDIDLKKLCDAHLNTQADVTLAVRNRITSRYLLFEKNGNLCGWESVKDKKKVITRQPSAELVRLAFCGIHVISGKMLKYPRVEKNFSIIKEYLRWAPRKDIRYKTTDEGIWADLGTITKIQEAEQTIPSDFFQNLF